MPVTNFLQWNPAEKNQESDSGYVADTQRVNGAPPGGTTEFPSVTANKLFFQCSTMATALAGFIVAEGLDASDSNLATLQANFTQAVINAAIAALKPTVIFLAGTGVGNYSTTSNSLVPVDATNLEATVTVPVGWKLVISANGTFYQNDQNASWLAAIVDSVLGTLEGRQVNKAGETPSGRAESIPFGISAVIDGDGAAHTVSLQFSCSTSFGTTIQNSSSEDVPTMVLMLTPSN